VIITSHNYGRFLGFAIDSALRQTVKPKEIIVVDDASDDNTEEVAKSFDDKIHYFKVNFRNVAKSRNFGFSKASGEYVVFLDADDYFREDFLEKTQYVLQKNRKILLVYSDRTNIGDEDTIKSINQSRNWKSQNFNYKDLRKNNYISLPSLIRKNNFNGFDEKIKGFEDWEAWLNFLGPGLAKRIPEPLFFVRFHKQNKTFIEHKGIERLKILNKHGVLNDKSIDRKKVFPPKNSRERIRKNNLVFLDVSDNIDDVAILLGVLKKSDGHYVYYILNGNSEDSKINVQMGEMLLDYGYDYNISNIMNSDQLLYSLKKDPFAPACDLEAIYVINKAGEMINIINGNEYYLGKEIFWSGRKDLLDCESIDELDVLFLNKQGIRKYFNI
jgi:glycosyltransferase involved in cell wall biosynthesis